MIKQIASRLGRAVSAGRKAFSMSFARARSTWYLPRTRFDYGDGSQSIDNSIVGACVLWLARNFPEAPFQVLKLKAQKWTQEPLHALALLIERPNMFYSGPLLWMATVIEFALFGNAYWVKVRNGTNGAVIQLWWVPNGMIEPKRDEGSNDLITHYEYKPGSIPIRLEVKNVVHFRFGIDPANMMKGLAPLRSLLREIFTDDEASNFTAALLKNLGVPGIVITPDSDDVDLDPEDAEAIREDFATKFTADGRGSAMVISSKSRVTQVSFSPEQMNLRELRRIPEERVSAVIGVPAVVVGLGAGLDRSTYSNMAEAKENAWEMGIIPMQRLLCSTLDVQLLPDFEAGRNFRTGFDLSQVRALQDDVDKLAARTDVGVKGGYVEVYEARQALGLMVDESMHYYIRSFNAVEVMADEAGANAPEPEPMQLPPGSVETVPPEALENTPKGARLRFVIKGRREREAAINNFAARLTPVLADLGERVAGKVKAVKAPGDDLVTDADVARLVRLLRGGHVEAVSRAAVESADAIGVDPFAIDDPVAVRLLNELGEDIVGITEETHRSVAQTVAAAREEGATSAEIAERLRNSHAFSAARARVIASTELTRAENRTSVATWKDSGFVESVTILDGDGCGWSSHDDPDLADGSTRTLDDFEEHEMAHPNCVRVAAPIVDLGKSARRNGHRELVTA